MKIRILTFIALIVLFSNNVNGQASDEKTEQEQSVHWNPTHNFTVSRFLIFNEKNEILMEQVESKWYPPSLVFERRQHIKEGLDSLTNIYGIKTEKLQLRAYLSFKYEYHPYATLRPYYTSHYKSGDISIPEGRENVKWMSINDVIKNTPVESMKELVKKITDSPSIVWGGSFMVYRIGEGHHTRQEEPLFPLFDPSVDILVKRLSK